MAIDHVLWVNNNLQESDGFASQQASLVRPSINANLLADEQHLRIEPIDRFPISGQALLMGLPVAINLPLFFPSPLLAAICVFTLIGAVAVFWYIARSQFLMGDLLRIDLVEQSMELPRSNLVLSLSDIEHYRWSSDSAGSVYFSAVVNDGQRLIQQPIFYGPDETEYEEHRQWASKIAAFTEKKILH